MHEPADESWVLAALAARIRENIRDVVAGESPETVAARTGLDPKRAADILNGALPDGYEVMVLEVAYQRPVWPGARDPGTH
jgi:hypothetical protein